MKEEDLPRLIRDLAEHARGIRPGFLVFPLNAAGLLESRPDLVPVLDGVVDSVGVELTRERPS